MSGVPATTVIQPVIDFAADRMAFRVRKYQLKKEVSLMLFGANDDGEPVKLVSVNGFEKICKRARELLRERSTIVSKEARDDSVGLYETIIADLDAPYAVKLRAQEQLDKIHNLVNIVNTNVIGNQTIKVGELDPELQKALLENLRDKHS